MFGLDDFSICIIILIIFIIFSILIVILLIKKYVLIEIKNKKIDEFKIKAIRIFEKQGYQIKYKKKGKIIVQSGNLTATGLMFKQKNEDIIIYRYSSSTNTADIIMLVGFIFTGLAIPFIISIIIEFKSKKFAKEEILPLLENYEKYERICKYCNKNIPFDAIICPYCAKKI